VIKSVSKDVADRAFLRTLHAFEWDLGNHEIIIPILFSLGKGSKSRTSQGIASSCRISKEIVEVFIPRLNEKRIILSQGGNSNKKHHSINKPFLEEFSRQAKILKKKG